MTKNEFIIALRQGLSKLPKDDIEKSVDFYCEIIADKTEGGIAEEQAIAELGSIEKIIAETLADAGLDKKEKPIKEKSKKLKTWEIVLIVLGMPLWLSLLVAALSVALALFAVIWAVVAVLYVVAICFIVAVLACIFALVTAFASGHIGTGLVLLGFTLLSAGLVILQFMLAIWATKAIVKLTKWLFTKKEK